MREFAAAVEKPDETDTETPVEFKVRGVVCKAYQPDDGQFGMFMASTSRHTSENEQIAGVINFFLGLLDKQSQQHVTDLLLDREVKFGIKDVEEIMEWLAEEWAARPTQEPSGSTASPPNIGPSSNPPTLVSTSSDSLPIGS